MNKQYVLSCLEALEKIADDLYETTIGSDDYTDIKDYINIIKTEIEK